MRLFVGIIVIGWEKWSLANHKGSAGSAGQTPCGPFLTVEVKRDTSSASDLGAKREHGSHNPWLLPGL